MRTKLQCLRIISCLKIFLVKIKLDSRREEVGKFIEQLLFANNSASNIHYLITSRNSKYFGIIIPF